MTLELMTELERFRHRLLDLSNRNPLLNFRKSKVRTLQVVDELPNKIFERLTDQNKAFKFLSVSEDDLRRDEQPDSSSKESDANRRFSSALPFQPKNEWAIEKRHTDNKLQTKLTDDQLDRVLSRISREAKRNIEETGINYLHLALGYIEWRETSSNAKPHMAPLMLIPIAIERSFDKKQGRYAYTARWTEEEVKFNISLAKRVESDFGIRIPEFQPDELPEQYFARVNQAIEVKQDWCLKRECDLGFFSFHKLMMYNDVGNWIDDNRVIEDSVVGQLICGNETAYGTSYGNEYELDNLSPGEDKVKLVLDADSSQHSALLDICNGESLVIEGPPGTGKSQTITNAIAALIFQGKSVLFVAEKMAALNVVKSKLEKLELGQFCLELHSDGATPRSVIGSLGDRIEAEFQAPKQLEQVEDRLESDKKAIKAYLDASSERIGPEKMPMFDVIWEIARLRGSGINALYTFKKGPEVSADVYYASQSALDDFSTAFESVGTVKNNRWEGIAADRLRPNQYPAVISQIEKLKKQVDQCIEITNQLTSGWKGSQQDWLSAATLENSDELKAINKSKPSRQHDLSLLLDSELFDRTAEILRLVNRDRVITQDLESLSVDSSKYELSVTIEISKKIFHPECSGQSIHRIDSFAQKIPAIQTAISSLESAVSNLNATLDPANQNDWIPQSIDKAIEDLELLKSISIRSTSLPHELLDVRNRKKTLDFCEELKSLRLVVTQSKKLPTGISESDAVAFGNDILRPLGRLFPDDSIRSLKRQSTVVDQVREALQDISQHISRLGTLGFHGINSLADLQNVESVLQLYEHPILTECGYPKAELFDPIARKLLANAKSEYNRLEVKKAALSRFFNVDQLPTLEEARHLIATICRILKSPARWLNPQYWLVKRRFSKIVTMPGLKLEAGINPLRDLESYLVALERFSADEMVKKYYGDLFQGHNTDWKALETLLRWVLTVQKRAVSVDSHIRIVSALKQESPPLSRLAIRTNRKRLESLLQLKSFDLAFQGLEPPPGQYRMSRGAWIEGSGTDVENPRFQIDLTNVESKIDRLDQNLKRLFDEPVLDLIDQDQPLETAIDQCLLFAKRFEYEESVNRIEKWNCFGHLYQGENSDLDEISNAILYVEKLRLLRFPAKWELAILDSPDTAVKRLLSSTKLLLEKSQSLAEYRPDFAMLQIETQFDDSISHSKFEELHDVCCKYAEAIKRLSESVSSLGFPTNSSLGQLFSANELLSEKKTIQDRFSGPLASSIGPFFEFASDEPQELDRCMQWVERISKIQLPVEKNDLANASFEQLNGLSKSLHDLVNLKYEYSKNLKDLTTFGQTHPEWLKLNNGPQNNQLEVLSRQLNDLSLDRLGLESWAEYCRARVKCNELSLEVFLNAVENAEIASADMTDTYKASVLENSIEEQVEKEPSLEGFTRKSIETIRQNIKDHDRDLLRLNRELIAHRASQTETPAGTSRGRVAEKTEMGLIHHELGKQTRHVQIRNLLKRAGKSVRALKPCFMMSPLSVSQFLDPSDDHFDVVVMDEASQIKPEDALGAVLRAKQLVVVGDPKQLPPTSFFDRVSEEVDEESETQFDDNESILEVAMKTFHPIRRLRWHYRSQHETLIQFSNDRFYENDLVIFPSSSKDSGSLGIYQTFVEGGAFSKGTNPTEAKAVAQAIAEHAIYYPGQSLGVGTFNMKQAGLILDELEELCEKNSKTRAALESLENSTESLFVKNLENLQGDERDVIFISYTYGPDPVSGKVYNRFGPLAGEGGWRRLNVMVSRARKRVEVFTSLRPSDIKAGSDKSRGINAYRDFLEFSQSGVLSKHAKSDEKTRDRTTFDEVIQRVVKDVGLTCKPRVGVAGFFLDVGVTSPYSDDTFLLGIISDGESYRNANSASDRDRLRDEVMQSRNWKLHRIWSTDWFYNQQNEERRLQDHLNELMSDIPKFFREVRPPNEKTVAPEYDDIEVCDQIVAYLKDNGYSTTNLIAEDVEIDQEQVEALLDTKLGPFVTYSESNGWALRTELVNTKEKIDTRRFKPKERSVDSNRSHSFQDARVGGASNELSNQYVKPQSDSPEWQKRDEVSVSEKIVQSSLFQSQKRKIGRIILDDIVSTKILICLEKNGWKSTIPGLAQAVTIAPFRLRGMIAGLQRVLNVDGQAVMTISRESDTVEVSDVLAMQEFLD